NWSALSLSDIGTIVGNGLTALTSGIVTFFEWVLIVLAIASPLWIPGLIVLFVLLRRHKKRKSAQPSQVEPEPSQPEKPE
ncbi:MAG: hypothetical protein LBR85_07710, partial [Oscillospiraceae bacterium]|nr:hypothetical protein [Oscillospiraceae bacterium]